MIVEVSVEVPRLPTRSPSHRTDLCGKTILGSFAGNFIRHKKYLSSSKTRLMRIFITLSMEWETQIHRRHSPCARWHFSHENSEFRFISRFWSDVEERQTGTFLGVHTQFHPQKTAYFWCICRAFNAGTTTGILGAASKWKFMQWSHSSSQRSTCCR